MYSITAYTRPVIKQMVVSTQRVFLTMGRLLIRDVPLTLKHI